MDETGAYKKAGDLGGARHGDAYQVHVLMMLYERAISNGEGEGTYADFRLATELEAAGKFDDAVLRWKSFEGVLKWLLVQVKHKLVPMQLGEKHFFPETEDAKARGEFSLYKYLLSFWDIMHRSEFHGEKQFVMFTNCGLEKCIQHWFIADGNELDPILKPGTSGEQFLKMPPKQEHIEQLLNYANVDFTELTETLRLTLMDGRNDLVLDLVGKYRGALVNKVLVVDKKAVKFTPRFIKRINLSYTERLLRNKLFKEDATPDELSSYSSSNEELQKILMSKLKSINTLPPVVENSEVLDFFNSLIFAIQQPDNSGMKAVILSDLRTHPTSPTQVRGSVDYYALLSYSTIQSKIHSRLDSPIGMSLRREDLVNDYHTIQRTISSSRLSVPTELFRGRMLNLRMELKQVELSMPEYRMAIVCSTREGLMTSLKMFLHFRQSSYIYFSLEDLRHRSIVDELCDALKIPNPNFTVLLLKDNCPKFEYSLDILNAMPTDYSIKLILLTDSEQSASRFFKGNHFHLLKDDETSFGHLTELSQDILKHKTILFQGFEVEVSDLADVSVLGDIIKNEALEDLIQDNALCIGPSLPDLGVKCYIPRTIARLDMEDRETIETNPNYSLEDDPNEKSCYSETQFLDDMPDVMGERRVFLLSSSPGMGKTTLWKKLAILSKQQFKTKWILFLKLQDAPVSEKLNGQDFLSSYFKLSQLDKSLLAHCLRKLDSVFIFIDGFDELPQMAMGSTISLIRALQKTARIFVNTRSRVQFELQGAFNVDTFLLNPISKSEQKELFIRICDFIDGQRVSTEPFFTFVDQLMDRIHSKSMQIANNFVGVPLVVNMLAEVYRPDIEAYSKTLDAEVLNKIELNALNIADLFEKFVYSSFRRQYIDKQKLSVDNHNTKLMLDRNNYVYVGFIKLHTFLGLTSIVTDKKMHLIIRDSEELEVLRRQVPLLDSPIVSRAPNFIHGSIAEYFAAKCLFKCLKRMSEEGIKKHFVDNSKKRKQPKKHYISNVFDIYYQVLRDYPTVRKIFFLIVHRSNFKINRLEMLLWNMRPYPLLWACEENCEKLAKLLIEEDSNIVHSTNKYKETALHLAAAEGHVEICILLINSNLEIDARNSHDQTALHKAASNGCEDVVTLLLTRGADISVIDKRRQTPLFLAAMAGHDRIVKLLMAKYRNLNDLNTRFWSALHIAAMNNHIEVVRTLLSKNAKHRIGRAKKWTGFLGILLARGHRKMVTLLVTHEVKSHKRNADTHQTLLWAVRRNHIDVVHALHRAGASINETDDRSGLSTYQLALKHGSFMIAEYILGVQKNIKNIEYALHEAAQAGSIGCTSILLMRKAEVNAVDRNGDLPLELALKKCHIEVVRMLLDKSATINRTMLINTIGANRMGSVECVKELLLHGADPSAAYEITGQTPLHFATLVNNYECTKLLLQRGASCLAPDRFGRTPLDYALILHSKYALKAILEVTNLEDLIKSGKIQKIYDKLEEIVDESQEKYMSRFAIEDFE